MFRVIIAGSRGYDNYEQLKVVTDFALRKKESVTIISGTARGADKLGERYAEEMGHNVMRFPADWEQYGKSAGYIRNKEMAEVADMLIAFWDGESKGTKNMISEMNKLHKPVIITHPDNKYSNYSMWLDFSN